MLSWLVPLKSNFIVAPGNTLKLPNTFMELIEPMPPGARIPARNTLLPALMTPPALTIPPPEPSVALLKPLQSRVPAVFALRRSSAGAAPVPVIEPEPEAVSAPTLKDVLGVVR
jgi:hypothetical protein